MDSTSNVLRVGEGVGRRPGGLRAGRFRPGRVRGGPILVADLSLDAELPELDGAGRYRATRLLARLHGRPIGEVHVPLDGESLSGAELAARVWPLIAGSVIEHCAEDGLSAPDGLPPSGLPHVERPSCQRRTTGELPTTVVIATRDRPGSLLRCLTSLAASTYSAFDVVVVDSASRSDATERALSGHPGWPFPLRYVREPRPGLARAHNAALPEVTGDVVAITDDDVQVDRDWLRSLAESFTEFGATCVTGPILPAELETTAQVLVERAGGFTRGFTRRVFTLGMPDAEPLFPFTAGRFGSGANMAFRAEWLTRVGFDPALGAGTPAWGGDDLSAFLRVVLDGGTLVYEPRAVVRHWHRREYEGIRRQAFHYGVGLGAYLTATAVARPALLGAMIARSVPAVRHLLSPTSAKNANQGARFPRELVWRERAGVLVGPFGYFVGRYRDRGSTRPAPRRVGIPA